jgi:hypothetical protein
MPEFEEAKPVNTKTDLELNSDSFSDPQESNQQHIPTPPSSPLAKKHAVRRSRYKSERRPAGVKPAPATPQPGNVSAPAARKDVVTPAPRRSDNKERSGNDGRENRQDRPQRQPRPPRNNQNRNRHRPREDNENAEDSQNRNRNRNRNRKQNREGDHVNSQNKQRRYNQQGNRNSRKPQAKKGFFGSLISTIKGFFGIKEEEPKKQYNRQRSGNRRPRRRKNYNQGTLPQGQRNHGGDNRDPQQSEDGQPKKFAKKRPRRRRRRHPNPENQQQNKPSDSSPKSENQPNDS